MSEGSVSEGLAAGVPSRCSTNGLAKFGVGSLGFLQLPGARASNHLNLTTKRWNPWYQGFVGSLDVDQFLGGLLL